MLYIYSIYYIITSYIHFNLIQHLITYSTTNEYKCIHNCISYFIIFVTYICNICYKLCIIILIKYMICILYLYVSLYIKYTNS